MSLSTRFGVFSAFAALSFACFTGCGKPAAENTAATPTSASTPATPTAASTEVPPTDIVSQFLDSVRRGGENSEAATLLTELAQSELKRIGRSVQPIGSPDARYEVTRAEQVPDSPGSALVHSVWTEPLEDGSTEALQVVWAMQRESAGWRISGLAMEVDPTQDPIVINFEDGDAMANLLAATEEAENQASTAPQNTQAATAPESISR